jgi:hypothetical protein
MALVGVGFGFVPNARAQTNGPTLKKIAEFDLPGPGGKRFDYLTIDQNIFAVIDPASD